jgi:hypothetical protein
LRAIFWPRRRQRGYLGSMKKTVVETIPGEDLFD